MKTFRPKTDSKAGHRSVRNYWRLGALVVGTFVLIMGEFLPGEQVFAQLSPTLSPLPEQLLRPAAESLTESEELFQSVDTSTRAMPESGFSTYRLGIGDVITVSIFGAEDYSGEFIVLPDGTINLPRAGQLFVLGLPLRDVELAVASSYAPFIRQPLITVIPQTLQPIRVALAGEIRRPGSYQVGDSGTEFPTLTEAIALAGGITGKADIRQIELRRHVGFRRKEMDQFNLWDLIQSGDLAQDIVLQSGDEIFIPTNTAVTNEDAIALASASFAPETVSIYIAGEVSRPGLQELPLNTSLNQAILASGNLTPRADLSAVDFIRVNPDGTVVQRRIAVDLSADINENNNPILTERDVIVVSRSGLARLGDSLGIVLNPVTQVLGAIFGFRNLFVN